MTSPDQLAKFNITALNAMQLEAGKAIRAGHDVVLLSPTGTGKTLAFLLPLLRALDPTLEEIQALVLVPTRELAQQIEQVARQLGTGLKINAVYGGRAGTLDKLDLRRRPALLIGTPGRVADRFRRDDYSLRHIRTLVLDEYDKSLEIGFETEMRRIVAQLPNVHQRILTSATSAVEVPDWVKLSEDGLRIDYLSQRRIRLRLVRLNTPTRDKLEGLVDALRHIGPRSGIVFCNFKDGLQRISDHLDSEGIAHGCFHGSMEQVDRERALVKFRNGTTRLLLATDLAARGLDVPALHFIVHYHLPPREREFTHRNGRTARMHDEGVAYLLCGEGESLPDYVNGLNFDSTAATQTLAPNDEAAGPTWTTVYVSGGRRDKISKGDIAGLFMKQGGLSASQLGVIELQQAHAYAGVQAEVASALVKKVNNTRLKRKKVRVSVLT